MELSALAGNPRLKEQLTHRMEGRGLSHAYIISGPAGSGRHTLARILCRTFVCTGEGERPCGRCAQCRKVTEQIHPDVISFSGPAEGKPITVDQIRTLRSDAHIRPNEAGRKIYLLEQADLMNASAQNAMLKLLEEGPAYAVFLLLAENAGGLLQTVRSRCEVLELGPVAPAECRSWLARRFPKSDPREVEEAALDCQGILGRAVARLSGADENRETRLQQIRRLADALEQGGELELFEASMLLEKAGKGELIPILEGLRTELVARCGAANQRKRLVRAIELTGKLREAAQVNANPGQLAGWLSAGMFV